MTGVGSPKIKNTGQHNINSVHEGKKPFQSESCDQDCAQISDMNQHIDSAHEGKKPFKFGLKNRSLHPWPSDTSSASLSNSSTASGSSAKDSSGKSFEFKFINASEGTRIVSSLKKTKA